jgi:adenine phosphoribosyltransferase
LILDDLFATGGTLKTAIELVESTGAEHMASFCIFELSELKGKEKLREPEKFISLMRY